MNINANGLFQIENLNQLAQCLNAMAEAARDYVRITEEEKTKRRAIEASKQQYLREIKAREKIMITYLEKSFDERSENFKELFRRVDRAMDDDNNEQLALLLNQIVILAKSNPFQNLTDINYIKKSLSDPGHTWDL